MPYRTSFAAFFSERLSDLLAIVALTLVGLSLHPAAKPLITAAGLALLLVYAGLSSGRLLKRCHRAIRGDTLLQTVGRQLIGILLEASRCQSPMVLAAATGLSLLAWAAEACAFYLLLGWMGMDASPAFAVFCYALSVLAGALTFLPGGLGGTEAVMVGLLLRGGLSQADAVAAAVLIRVATLWFAVLLGVLTATRCHPTRSMDRG